GSELNQQKQERERLEQSLALLGERLAEISRERTVGSAPKLEKDVIKDLRSEVRSIRSALGASIPKPKRVKPVKVDVVQPCPGCGTQLTYKQRSSARSYKLVPCGSCRR